MLHSGLKMDVQVLERIIIGHMNGHIEVDSIHRVHHLDKAIHIHTDIIIDWDAQHPGYFAPQCLDPVVIDRVDLGKAAVHQRISRNGH